MTVKELKGTRTAENLLKAFAGESQAGNRYTFYAGIAKREGYAQIGDIFLETAGNEQAHAKRFFGFLCQAYAGEEILIQAGYPAGMGTTAENLRYAADGEYDEWANLYPSFGDLAEAEGFAEIAACFRSVAQAEVAHETRYRKLLESLEAGRVFRREEDVDWKCGHCGYIHYGKAAPESCPSCQHPKDYFEVLCENY